MHWQATSCLHHKPLKMINFPTKRDFVKFFIILLGVFFYCEYLGYYVVLLQCTWPTLEIESEDPLTPSSNHKPLKVMLLSDPHLLGQREGHWFDKLRREWHMQRTFQTAMLVHSPDVVFILGDILDEGKWCNDEEFEETIQRFHKIFHPPSKTKLHVVVGNHDIGFHYAATAQKIRRFNAALGADSVQLIDIEGIIFVLINSMAMEGDGCSMCSRAESKLKRISKSLKCSQGKLPLDNCKDVNFVSSYSKPVLLQHFPLFRPSDKNCTGEDSASGKAKYGSFQQRIDCLSQEATNDLLHWLDPRLVFTGHTHNGCFTLHKDTIPEYTIASISWRNRNNPNFLLATMTENNHAISKCHTPKESTVINIYIAGGLAAIVWLIFPRRYTSISLARKSH